MRVTICIPGDPEGKKTPHPVVLGRRIKVGGQVAVLNAVASAEKAPETRAFEKKQAEAIKARWPAGARSDGPLSARYLFVIARPLKLHRKADDAGLIPAPVKPDTDNLVKAAQDALIAAVGDLIGDDARIVTVWAAKRYAEKDGRGPRTVIHVTDEDIDASWVGELAAFDPLDDGGTWETLP